MPTSIISFFLSPMVYKSLILIWWCPVVCRYCKACCNNNNFVWMLRSALCWVCCVCGKGEVFQILKLFPLSWYNVIIWHQIFLLLLNGVKYYLLCIPPLSPLSLPSLSFAVLTDNNWQFFWPSYNSAWINEWSCHENQQLGMHCTRARTLTLRHRAYQTRGTRQDTRILHKDFSKWETKVIPPLTWPIIISALESPSVAEYSIAQELRLRHLHTMWV